MRLFTIFFCATLITGQVGWAEEKVSVVEKVALDVISGKVQVRPSVIPPDVFDRLYNVEVAEQLYLEKIKRIIQETLPNSSEDTMAGFELGWTIGQAAALQNLLYTASLITDSSFDNITGAFDMIRKDNPTFFKVVTIPRFRTFVTMLFLRNYKEPNPIPPGDIVQVTITK